MAGSAYAFEHNRISVYQVRLEEAQAEPVGPPSESRGVAAGGPGQLMGATMEAKGEQFWDFESMESGAIRRAATLQAGRTVPTSSSSSCTAC